MRAEFYQVLELLPDEEAVIPAEDIIDGPAFPGDTIYLYDDDDSVKCIVLRIEGRMVVACLDNEDE